MQFLTAINVARIRLQHLLRRFSRSRSISTVSGYKFEIDSTSSLDAALANSGRFEADISICVQLAGETPIESFIDVGANAGHWSIALSSQAQNVIAFEPIPGLAQKLRRNIQLNEIQNIQIFEIALANETAKADFYVREALDNAGLMNDGLGSLVNKDSHVKNRISVLVDTLDNVSSQFPGAISLIKIDVEGAEELVLRGSQNVLGRDRPIIVTEVLRGQASSYCSRLEDLLPLFPNDYKHFYLDSGSPDRLTPLECQQLSRDFNLFSFPARLLTHFPITLFESRDLRG
jgi:FkbM family methyltransferase